MSAADAILLTGTVGVGKTTVLTEIGEILDAARGALRPRRPRLARVDPPRGGVGRDGDRRAVREPAAGGATFRSAGVRRIAVARAICDPGEVEAIRVALGADRLTVARLTAAPPAIERRLRARDRGAQLTEHLLEARAFSAAAEAAGIGDVVLPTDDADPTATARAALAQAKWI